jgi:CRP/FNR family transcriptional regulator, anaerobic regulatory protein
MVKAVKMKDLQNRLSFLGIDLAAEIIQVSTVKKLPKGTEILKEGQYIKALPIVLDGLVKIFSRFNDRELLLYYIKPDESCVMSLSASLNNEPSKIFAVAEEDAEVLLIPVEKIPLWLKNFPRLNNLFYQQYNLRYIDLLDTIHHVLFDKMDKRLYDYLKEKARLTNQQELKITHHQIANELGTVREVITRVMKKLETEGKIKQESSSIKILKW